MIDNPERLNEMAAFDAALKRLERPFPYQVAQNEPDFALPDPNRSGYVLWHSRDFAETGTPENIEHIDDPKHMRAW